MRIGWFFLALPLSFSFCRAQQPAHRPNGAPRQPVAYVNWIGRLALSEGFARETGLTAGQAEALKAAFLPVESRGRELEKMIRELARKQVALYNEAMTKPGVKGERMFALVDKISKCRAEQAKLSIKTLLVIRDTLDAGQREKAHAYIRAAGRKRAQERRRVRAALREAEKGRRSGAAKKKPGLHT